MSTVPRSAAEETQSELSPEWLAVCGRIRDLASGVGPEADAGARRLAVEALQLCGHVERLHASAERWLQESAPDAATPVAAAPEAEAGPVAAADAGEEKKEALNIQREIHQDKLSVREVIKALFLWQDAPGDRMRPQGREED